MVTKNEFERWLANLSPNMQRFAKRYPAHKQYTLRTDSWHDPKKKRYEIRTYLHNGLVDVVKLVTPQLAREQAVVHPTVEVNLKEDADGWVRIHEIQDVNPNDLQPIEDP